MSILATSSSPSRLPAIITMWVGFLLAIVEALLVLRLILKLVGATASNWFVNLIYDITGPLVRPFEGIIQHRTVGTDGVFEPEVVIALVIYPLLAWLVTAIIGNVWASAPRTSRVWQDGAADLYVRLSSLHDSLAVSAAAGSPFSNSPEVDGRIEGLTQSLHSLELSPPNAQAGTIVHELIDALNGARVALKSDTARQAPPAISEQRASASAPAAPAGGTGPSSVLEGRLSVLGAALQRFRTVT